MERLQMVRRQQLRLLGRFPGGIASLTVIEQRVFLDPIGAKERAEAAAIAKEMAPHTRAIAYVVEGSGFRTVTTRMILTGVNMVARPEHPVKVFDNPVAGAEWIATQLGKTVNESEELLACVGEARAAMPPSAE
jgi:hypothetical protein